MISSNYEDRVTLKVFDVISGEKGNAVEKTIDWNDKLLYTRTYPEKYTEKISETLTKRMCLMRI